MFSVVIDKVTGPVRDLVKFWHILQKWRALGKADVKDFIWFEHGANNARLVGLIPVWPFTYQLDLILVDLFQLGIFCDLWQVRLSVSSLFCLLSPF